jgi:aminopeptidase
MHSAGAGWRVRDHRGQRTRLPSTTVNDAEQLAELAVVVGANVQPGQLVRVSADVAHAELVRAVADAAYRHGASLVEADFSDLLLQRSQVLYARDLAQATRPSWWEAGLAELADAGGARIMIHAPTGPGLFDDLDPGRVNLAEPARSSVWRGVEYAVNNTIIPGPNEAWATALHPDLPPARALARLWDQINIACRVTQPYPVDAWRRRFAELRERAEALNALELEEVRLAGPGTDLRIGLLPTARWEPPTNVNVHGVEHAWNLPSEEVYTVPDPDRVDGAPALREYIDRDPGTSRLGELALVDGDSAVGSVGQAFGMIMLDENTASHIALGFGFPALVDPSERDRVNQSSDHLDLTVGSDELRVTGHHADGHEQLLLHHGRWHF